MALQAGTTPVHKKHVYERHNANRYNKQIPKRVLTWGAIGVRYVLINVLIYIHVFIQLSSRVHTIHTLILTGSSFIHSIAIRICECQNLEVCV